MKKRLFLVLFTLLSAGFGGFAQSASAPQPAVIYLRNPSFEADNRSNPKPTLIEEWQDCGFENRTPPDIQPGKWSVLLPPSNGKTYISMVTRRDGTYEGLSQELSSPLKQKTMYLWEIDLCSSNKLTSPQPSDAMRYTLFNTPIKLYVWGGKDTCEKAELLDSTNWVENTNWQRYAFVLNPKQSDYAYITIEVNTGIGATPKVCGNVMVDNASPLRPLSASPSDSLVTVDFIRKWFNPRLLSESWKRGSVLGTLHVTDDLAFTRQDTHIKSSSTAPLEMLVENLNQFPHLNVEIGAHTAANVDNATEVSTHRAQLVADWLIEKGIDPQRITHKGYGKTMLYLYEEKARGAEARNCVVVRVE